MSHMTIRQVALAAGVPYATAWRAVHQRGKVSQSVAAAVGQAMEELGFQPTPVRRSRTRADSAPATAKASRKIALLDLRNTTALSISILRSVQQLLGGQGMNMLYAHVVGPAGLPTAVEAGEVDGILGYGEIPASLVTTQLKRIPAVWMMS